MKDLMLKYKNENGDIITKSYETIMDFIDLMMFEIENIDIPMLDYENVDAIFFENKLNIRHFDTIEDLLKHCLEIVR